MRRSALVGALFIAGAAQASFDLMLLGDNTTAGSQRVMRYDPVNRVVLGSFGQGFLNDDVANIAVDTAGDRAFVLQNNGGVRVFDYNTGALLGAFQASGFVDDISYDSVSNRLTIGNGIGGGTAPVLIYDATSFATLTSLSTDRFISTAPLRRPGTNWYASFAIDNLATTNYATRHSTGGGAPLSGEVTGPAYANFNAPRNSIITNENRLLGISSSANANSTNLWAVGTDANGYTTAVTAYGSLGAASPNANIVNGHGSLAYILMGTTLTSYHTGLNSTLGSHSLSFSSNIRGMAIVLAPEPGSMFALGAGVLAYLKRRRRA